MIKIESKKNKFTYNVYHVTKAFYPKEDIVQTVDEKQEPLVKIHLPEGTCFSLAPEECVQTEDVQEEKRDVTKKVYQFLSKQTGQELAWGMLTGVRPTKLVMQKIEQGMTKEEIFEFLKEQYCVGDKKAQIAYEIACRDNLLMLFEDETSLSERQLTVLNEFEHPLSQLYTDWLSRDTDEMDAFRDSIACCANDILRKRVEEKYRDPAQPIYPNTRSEAMAPGEGFEWMGSRDRTLTCAGTFEKDATSAYNDGKLPAFLKEWTNTYGKDRCMFVLACTMAQRTGDERFYPPARQAAGRFAALQKQMGGHPDVYAVDNHSCVINAAMEQLAKPERSVEQKTVKKNTPER